MQISLWVVVYVASFCLVASISQLHSVLLTHPCLCVLRKIRAVRYMPSTVSDWTPRPVANRNRIGSADAYDRLTCVVYAILPTLCTHLCTSSAKSKIAA